MKRQKLSDLIKKARPRYTLPIRNQFKYKNRNRLKVRAWKKYTILTLFLLSFYFNPGIVNIQCTTLTLNEGGKFWSGLINSRPEIFHGKEYISPRTKRIIHNDEWTNLSS